MNLIKKCILRLVLYVGYGLLGSWLFCLIEKREETYSTTGNRMLEKLRKNMAVKYNLTNSTEFDEFVSAAFEAIATQSQTDWTFITGCAFTFAAITTVGYGDISPQTPLGKGFVIPYCLVGLTLTLLALKSSGEVVLLALKTMTINFEKKVLKYQQHEKKLVKCFTVIASCLVILICILSGLEVVLEDWTFLDGVYCWFVTFTTIGFGDFVPFQQYREKNKNTPWKVYLTGVLFTVPFIVGLCLVSSLLSVLVQGSENIKVHFHKVCSCCGHETELKTAVNGEDSKNNIRLETYGVRAQKDTPSES